MASSLRIIVTGLVGLYPVGGIAWDYLQYVIGLARLGHDVYYHEDTWSLPYHPLKKEYTLDGSYSAKYIGDFLERYAPKLSDRWHYLHLHSESFGMSKDAFDGIARTADLFLNINGACMIPDHLSPRCVKVFLGTDPGYNQLLLSKQYTRSQGAERWYALVKRHDQHFTYAENIHSTECPIPKMNFKWKTTRMPVVLDLWKPVTQVQPPKTGSWTTVMTWNALKGNINYKDTEYKSKESKLDPVSAQEQTTVPLIVAVGGVNAPIMRLSSQGWKVVDKPSVTLTPEGYQEFIGKSRGEFSPAKHVYIAMHSGWFSCRSACYLAAGRPVVVQDTGFSAILPMGGGILPFTTMAEAVAAIHEVEAKYTWHAKSAQEIAQEYFNSHKVLSRMLDAVFSS